MENIDIKKIIIAILIVIILAIGIFFALRFATVQDKDYTLEVISEEDYKYFSVYTDGKYGVINTNGEMIINNEYTKVTIPNPTKAIFICVKEDNSKEILNENGEKILTNFQNVSEINLSDNVSTAPYEKSVLQYEENGKYGLIDYNGKIITKPIYEEIASLKYKEGEILAKKDGKYGVINNRGVVLVPFEYDDIVGDRYNKNSKKDAGYIVSNVTEDGYMYGYINYKWKKLLNTEYTEINRILDTDSEDIYLIASKDRKVWLDKE